MNRLLNWLRSLTPSSLALAEIETLKAERDALRKRLEGSRSRSPFVSTAGEFSGEFDYEQHDCGRGR